MQLKIQAKQLWLSTSVVDFRRGIDGLCEIIETSFDKSLQDSVFIFLNHDRKKAKLLMWHKNGFILIYKRLEQGRFTLAMNEAGLVSLDEKQLSWLLAGLDWVGMSTWNGLRFDNYF